MIMEDDHGATRHMIAKEVFLLLVKEHGAKIVPARAARMAWVFADAYIGETILTPAERARIEADYQKETS